MDVARLGRLHAAAPRTRLVRGPPTAMGAEGRDSRSLHSVTSSQRVSPAACNDRHAHACTEIGHAGPRSTQRHPKTAKNSLSSHQTSCVNSR